MPVGARAAGVALIYLIGTLVFWGPLPLQLTTHVWGDRFDAWTTLWLVWHLADQGAELTAVTDRILYPMGYNLWSFGHAALQAIGAGLAWLGLPLVLAYNLTLLGAHWTSGLAAHLFGRELGGSHRAGFVAGIVFSTSPYLYGEGAAGCVELVAAGVLPLFGWALVRLAREPGIGRAAAAAGILAAIGPFNWYYTLFAGMLGVGVCGWMLFVRPRAAAWIAGAMLVAAALDAPLIPLVRRETPTRPEISAALFADPAAWARARRLADGELPLAELDDDALREHDAMQVAQNQTSLMSVASPRFTLNPLGSTPGLLAYLCGAAGVAMARGRARGWLLIAVGATVLTFGPWPMIDDTPPIPEWATTVPLPYGWAYTYLPFFSKAYRPYRIGVVALTALAAAAATGLAGRGDRRWDIALVALGIVGFTQPFWAGERPGLRPLADATVPEVYTQLRDLPDGAVIELPLRSQPVNVANARLQYDQVVHRKPLLNCNQLIRRTELAAFRDYVLGNALLRTLAERPDGPWRFRDADVAALLGDGFRYLVLHPRVPVGGELDRPPDGVDLYDARLPALLRALFGEPVVDDPEAQVWATPAAWPGDRAWTWEGGAVDVVLPIDSLATGLPMVFAEAWPAGRGRVSFWAKATDVPLRVIVDGEERVPALSADAWTRVEAVGDVALVGGAYVTRLQVAP